MEIDLVDKGIVHMNYTQEINNLIQTTADNLICKFGNHLLKKGTANIFIEENI